MTDPQKVLDSRVMPDANQSGDHFAILLDAVLGRWTQEDKIGFNGQDPNLYRYVGNGPTNATDPSGLAGYDEGPSMRADDRGDFRRWIDEKRAQTKQILEQTFYGHYYEGETTRAGALGQVVAGFVDVDIPTDVTDLYHDVTHFRNERDYYGTLATDVLGVIPLIGAVKGVKGLKEVKNVGKAAEAADALKPLAKAGEEVLDEAKPLLKNLDCPVPRGGANPAVAKAAGRGSTLHADKPGHLPDQLRQRYPETEFEFNKPGVRGQDVRVVGGRHPSDYPDSTWPKGRDFGDFKPDTPGGRKTFGSDQKNKWPDPTNMLPYDPKPGKIQ